LQEVRQEEEGKTSAVGQSGVRSRRLEVGEEIYGSRNQESRKGISEIEGKAARVAGTECGKRRNFKAGIKFKKNSFAG